MRTIDLNADVGEDPGAFETVDVPLLGIVTSANVACGGHAGDGATMAATVRTALAHGVAVGAHPSYPDRERFGRVELPSTPAEVEAFVAGQIGALGEVARSLGGALRHVKPHGALYHVAARRADVAEAIARGAARWSRDLVLVGFAGSPCLDVWRTLGFRAAGEAFADRHYEPDGSLRARALPGALITDPGEAAAQAVALVADTICVHSDTPHALEIARAVRAGLERAGMRIAPTG